MIFFCRLISNFMLKITGTHIIHESPISHEAVVAAVTHNILSVHPQEKEEHIH